MKALIAPVLLLLAPAAWAQDAAAPASTATGNAQAANNVQVGIDTISYLPADSTVKHSGHTYSTPVVAGSYFAGANPCLVGTGVGAAGGPVGFNINLGKSDKGCQRRADAGAWHALGFTNVAIARMCEDQKNADAWFANTGEVCPGADPARYKLANGSIAPISVISNPRVSGRDMPKEENTTPLAPANKS